MDNKYEEKKEEYGEKEEEYKNKKDEYKADEAKEEAYKVCTSANLDKRT